MSSDRRSGYRLVGTAIPVGLLRCWSLVLLVLSAPAAAQTAGGLRGAAAEWLEPVSDLRLPTPLLMLPNLRPNTMSAPAEERFPHALAGRRAWEVSAVAVTGLGHLGFRALDASHVFIPLASIAWGGYFLHRARRDSTFLSQVGLSSNGLAGSFRDASLVSLAAAGLMAAVAAGQGSLQLHEDLLPLFVLYPVWGLVQQALVQGMVARNLIEADGWSRSPYVTVPVTALLFGMVHLPDWKLTAATTGIGLAFTPIYLKHRNVWPLGLYHGLLGALFYFWVLEENPWRNLTH